MKGNNRAKVGQFRSLVEPGVLPCTHIGHGVRVVLDWDYHRLAHAANQVIVDLTADYPRAARLYTSLLTDPQTLASWDLTDYMAVERLGYNDHGQMHAQVVAANALRLLDLLQTAGVTPAVIDSGAGTPEDAFVVVLAAALLHDIGTQVAREGHEAYSVMLAQPVLARLLPDLYPDPVQAQVLTGFILAPVTLEGAVVAVADGADMTQGRGRVAFDRGKADIHAVSAMAIQAVNMGPGDATPVHIEVTMNDSAGLFQVEKLLGRKLILSGLERYVSLRACVIPAKDEAEQTIHRLVLNQGHFQPEEPPYPDDETSWPVDPVCGMTIAPEQTAGVVVYRDKRYLFCSTACLSHFQDNPAHYVQGEAR